MSTIKGTLRHNRKGGGGGWGGIQMEGKIESSKVQIRALIAQQGREKRKQKKRAKVEEFVPYP